jgi:hypothetical protein
MRHLLLGVAAAFAVINPASAQVPSPPAYAGAPAWRYAAPTPDDAYRQGLINRWELERIEGPVPQALQGPNANGSKGMQVGQ